MFSPERLEQHAESLAEAQTTGDLRLPWFSFARRSADNERVLVGAYEAIAVAVDRQGSITPAAEWLLNNFHIVEEQIRDIRSLLPSSFFRELPALDSGPLIGLPASTASRGRSPRIPTAISTPAFCIASSLHTSASSR